MPGLLAAVGEFRCRRPVAVGQCPEGVTAAEPRGGPRCRRLVAVVAGVVMMAAAPQSDQSPKPLRRLLDAPLLFVKRHSYRGIHIYDTCYKWGPGGGIYLIENPWDPPEKHRIRAIIDPHTPETLGEGIYSDPDISWDGKRLLFCFKGEPNGSTSIYEIGIDGSGLRRLTDPTPCCEDYEGRFSGVHDLSPAYLPDGRIVFISTRPNGLVPCFNTGVGILHVMNADGSGIRPISVNYVNEFDPCVLPDGRILHGRWEYVDKTALTQQSLWTIFPDGTNETALFANNMVHPEALLDARPVPGAPHLVAATLTPHNSPPRGTVGIIDTRVGKNTAAAITNFEYPDRPTYDRGNSCEPWPLSSDVLLFSGRPPGYKYNVIEIRDRSGRREVIHAEPDICCHSPMLVKPRARPPVLKPLADRAAASGRFFVQDIYQGLKGVPRGEVKWLRVIEETSRISPTPGGAMNQTFLMSGVLAWSAKNFLGLVPVEPDGSAYFEVPSGRTLYLQALDAQMRLVQSMRTFVQASPGVTRSCIGCHEHKNTSPANTAGRLAMRHPPHRPQPESWGSGFIDYPSMVQPVLDRHCVRCHGGQQDIAGGIDLSGGWTEYFNISYENLISRRQTQLVAYWIAGIDCMNGTSRYSAQILAPRSHGSGAAPLAELLVTGHDGRIPELTQPELHLLLAWIDTNGLYHGTWDYTEHGCRIAAWGEVKGDLIRQMRAAGCMPCHESGGRVRFEDDWFNLQRPQWSRILRAPLAKDPDGLGLALCRDRKVDPTHQRIRILVEGHYLHADLPLEHFKPEPLVPPRSDGVPVVTFTSTADPHYQAMLSIIRQGRRRALAAPRVDMPGAQVRAGRWRQLLPPPLPDPLPAVRAEVDPDGLVHLSWERSARTVGLLAEVHRGGDPEFKPTGKTLVAATPRCEFTDSTAAPGLQHYAVVFRSGQSRSQPVRVAVLVPPPRRPEPPQRLRATPAPGRVELTWQETAELPARYHVYRAPAGSSKFVRLTDQPTAELVFYDIAAGDRTAHSYLVRTVSRRGVESEPAGPATATPLPEIKEPLFAAPFDSRLQATLYGGGSAPGRRHGKARIRDGALDLQDGGYVTFEHRPEFDLRQPISVECWVKLTRKGPMPVVVSCGVWRQAGWFLQRIGAGWRWHVGGIDCDGGQPAPNRWTHLVGTYDGRVARLFQDGKLVAQVTGHALTDPWPGPLHVGQYSGGPAKPYQVFGSIRGLKVYGRALTEAP